MNSFFYPQTAVRPITMAVTAPSSGLGIELFKKRFELVKGQHEAAGYEVSVGKCLFDNQRSVSAPVQARAQELIDLFLNPNIDIIQPPWGGQFAIELLEHLDFNLLSNNPTWLQGYSDISTLCFPITCLTGMATVHGTNFMDSVTGQDELTAASKTYLSLNHGESFIQKSSHRWQEKFEDYGENLGASYKLTKKTRWQTLSGKDERFSGRIIGGCLDTLKHLIGTPFGRIDLFRQRCGDDDNVILYLENCNHDPAEFYRVLHSMKYAGWFEQLGGLILGRNNGVDSDEFSYLDAVTSFFKQEKYAVIFDADIGHKPPQMTIINGCFAELEVKDSSATLKQTLR